MSEYTRVTGFMGEEVVLRAVFTDSRGELMDPDSLPVIYIYDSSIDSEIIDAEIESGEFDNALDGPLTAVKLSVGFYQYSYNIPTGYDTGIWHDIWLSTFNGLETTTTLSFSVENTPNIEDQVVGNNTMLIIELDDSIINLAGDSYLEKTSLYYTTTYDPLFGSPDLVRTEVGPWIDYIPDNTLALMLHWASKEAKFIQGWSGAKNSNLQFARTKFVIFDAALRAVMYPGGGNAAGYTTGGSKQLGDLKIDQGEVVSTLPDNVLSWLQEQRREWWRVVNAGALIVPGEGLGSSIAVKGLYDPDRRVTGRLWEKPQDVKYAQPTVNQKRVTYPRRRGRWSFNNIPRIKNNTGVDND